MVALFYIIDTSRVNRKTIWCLKHEEDISKLSSCDSEWNLAKASALPHVRRKKLHGLASVLQLQTKILLKTALEVTEPVPNIKNRYQRTGKSNRCKTNGDNNVSHVIKTFVEHILWKFITHVYSDILHWYSKVLVIKFIQEKKTLLFYMIWKTYKQCLQGLEIIAKPGDHIML